MSKWSNSVALKVLAVALGLAVFASGCGGGTSDTTEAADSADSSDSATQDDASQDDAADTGADEADDAGEPEPTEVPETVETNEPEPTAVPEPAEDLEPLTASATGVTETEMHIGIAMLDFGALAEFNLVTEGWGDQILVYQSYIDDLNARGGIHGRTVVPHYEHYSPLGSTEAEAACAALTKDIETFVILGGFLGPAEVANNCIVETNDTMLIGGRQTNERLAAATAPWVDTATLRDRRLDVFLNLLDANDMLDGRNVAVIGSIEQEDIYDVAADTLAGHGITPVLQALNDAPQGDIIATDSRWQVLAENVRASGADTVLLIGSTQGGVRGVAANGLDVEVWVLESTGLENLGAETTPDDAHGAITITGLTDQQQWDDETVAHCKDIFSAANPDVALMDPDAHADGDEQWFKSIHLYCRNMAIFELLANGAGRNPTQDTWQAAIDGAGEFSLPGVPFASFSADKPDASDSFQLTRFDAATGEAGALVSISEVFDGTP